MTINEWIVLAWIFTSLVEEIRQMLSSSNADSIKERVIDWWNFSAFNRIDLFILIIASIGFGMRFDPNLFQTAKALYCVNAVLFFIRLLREYSASSFLGPKLVMITTMMRELLLYIMILVVFLLAYGVSTQALMYPIRDPYPMIIKDIFYYPYWQIYGELFLEELEGRTSDCLGNSTIMEDGVTPCPTYHWMVPLLTAAYLLVGNLLLLNILIAIFNHVFNQIQTNSIQIWKYGMYFLVVEYDNKPSLAPPFIILAHIAMLIKWLICKACCKRQSSGLVLSHQQESTLHIFEKECCKHFINQQKMSEKDNMHKQIRHIRARVDEMAQNIEEDRLLEQQHYEAEQNKLNEPEKIDDSLLYPTCSLNLKSPRRRSHHSLSQENPKHQKQLQDNMNVTFESKSTGPKYSKWPSLEKIKWLKRQQEINKMEAIRENQSSGMTTGLDSMCSSTRESPVNWASLSESELETLTRAQEEEELYDQLILRKPQPKMSDPTYDQIVPKKQPKTEKKPSQPNKFRKKRRQEAGQGDDGESKQASHTRRREAINKVPSNAWDNLAYSNSDDSEDERQVKEEMTKHLRASHPDQRKVLEMEERLKKLEETTQASLYNIEALLRNAVFSGGLGPQRPNPLAFNPPPPAPVSQPSRPTSKSKPRPYAYRPLDED